MAPQGVEQTRWNEPQIGLLPGERLHLQHGPIDLVIRATGDAACIRRAYGAATERFQTVLCELTDELVALRKPLADGVPPVFQSPIARRMVAACRPYRVICITPMAAVAGAVADEMLATMLAASASLHTIYVNNGGDIAVHIAEQYELKIGVVAELATAVPEGSMTIRAGSGVGGIATSGWRGRSFSLGIADAVTILATTAAGADAAATVVANAVNADDPAIARIPARLLDPDSDLLDRLVTTDVGELPQLLVQQALEAGASAGQQLINQNRIIQAFLTLQGQNRILTAIPEKSLS